MNITEFQKSRFGLFIHWGIYSIPARGEWVRSNEEMKEEDYIPFKYLVSDIICSGTRRKEKDSR